MSAFLDAARGFNPRSLDSHPKPLGRRTPSNFDHVAKHPFAAAAPDVVENVMPLPWWHWSHDQGQQGACAGHGTAMERAIRVRYLNRMAGERWYTKRVNPWWLWDYGKANDEWSDTNPGDDSGTSVHAVYDGVRTLGAPDMENRTTENGYPGVREVAALTANTDYKVGSNVWATHVDQMRAAIRRNQPVTVGINWYDNFDTPTQLSGRADYVIGQGSIGSIRGGHATCIYGASDRLQAFKMKNSWGRSYPLVWVPYPVMQRLLDEQGEACAPVDK